MNSDQLEQDLRSPDRTSGAGHFDDQGLAGVFVDDDDTFQLLSVCTAIEGEIVGSYLLGYKGRCG